MVARLDARNRIATFIEKLAHCKNLSSKSAPLIPTELTSAFHLTNVFLFSRHHIPTNSVAPLSAYKPTQTQFLQSLWRRANARNVTFFNPLRWSIYLFNSVVNTELPAIPSHRRSTMVSLETYPLYSILWLANNQLRSPSRVSDRTVSISYLHQWYYWWSRRPSFDLCRWYYTV